MRRRWVPITLLAGLTLAALSGLVWLAWLPLPSPDPVMASDLLGVTREHWPRPELADYPAGPDFSVIDRQGRVVVARGESVSDQLTALGHGYSSLDVVVAGEPVGQLFLADPARTALAERQRWLAIVAGLVVLGGALAAAGVVVWTELRILRPFERLREHAQQVAAGRLEVPLRMDRGNAFGAFTEAFDVLRQELQAARVREQEMRDSKQALIAQLGHDIRTPLATIRSTAELLQLGSLPVETERRLTLMVDKSDQIANLLDDLNVANRDELANLDFVLRVQPMAEIAALLRSADPREWIGAIDLPDLLVVCDQRRLLQVFDNILTNAYKYGAAPLVVTATVEPEVLTLALQDSGGGAPAAELPLLTARGVRGANSAGIAGSGFGLYTSAWIMERMAGSLALRNSETGLEVLVSLALAGRGAEIE